VRGGETAEDAVRRHAQEQFGVGVTRETFFDTVYVEESGKRYIANLFRAAMGEGPMRFRGDGDYDDARWLAASELAAVTMPADVRASVERALSEPEKDIDTDWSKFQVEAAAAAGEALPLGEQKPVKAEPVAGDEPPPDNRAGWDAIAKAYQEERYGDRDAGRLKWSWGLFEDELHVLPDDVRGQRAIVLGCGGGQDVVALERMGARAAGIDLSGEQIAYARKYAARHGAENASFVEGTYEDLSRFDDASFDLAVSIHALAYASDLERAFAEAARVLRPGGVLAIAVPHPLNQVFGDEPPYFAARSYWDERVDWTWEFENGASGRLGEQTPTVSRWFELFTSNGFTVERLLEPYQGDVSDEGARLETERMKLIPWVLIFVARKR
jgi:SAM-dependent methyltransferase